MISSMSKSKKPAGRPASQDRSPVITLRLGHIREERLRTWMESQTVVPEKTATILKAIDKFLDGFNVPVPKGEDGE